MIRTLNEPIISGTDAHKRERVQEDFGRHIVEQRNRTAALVRKWIEADAKFPLPIYDRLLERIRRLEPSVREDIASISLLMADEIVSAVLIAFARGDEMRVDDSAVNYAVIAQFRCPNSDDVLEEVDVNRGKPPIAIWDRYKRWLSRYAPSDLRPRSSRDRDSAEEA